MQRDLLDQLAAYPRIARILRARIITDLVSFCDCLVTRPVSPGALQAMDGLDKLIEAKGQSSASIDTFVAASNFLAELQTVGLPSESGCRTWAPDGVKRGRAYD